MELIITTSTNRKIKCRSFFDIDDGFSGIDVSENGDWLGEIYSRQLPDENDDEDVKNFIKYVENWLDEL